jgi:hypothetical protein
MQIGDRFVIYTEVLREGFALNRVVVFGSQGNGSEAIAEAEFIARKNEGESLNSVPRQPPAELNLPSQTAEPFLFRPSRVAVQK